MPETLKVLELVVVTLMLGQFQDFVDQIVIFQNARYSDPDLLDFYGVRLPVSLEAAHNCSIQGQGQLLIFANIVV